MIDPVSNTLTKIRNAVRAGHPTTEVPASRFIEQLLGILKQEGYIRSYKRLETPPSPQLRIYLKYGPNKSVVITQLKRASRPGQRLYRRAGELPRVLGGLGVAILTTSKGLMTDQEARKQRVGGEVLCYVW
ncbi:MAG: 30S ribosomal protein S8 [Candidatus Omnitrophica bacterium]|nr:30S ribosomal protein S8 [Candidatus Omnitrophota bacterium]